jgi:acetone carboxylase gamma subunit
MEQEIGKQKANNWSMEVSVNHPSILVYTFCSDVVYCVCVSSCLTEFERLREIICSECGSTGKAGTTSVWYVYLFGFRVENHVYRRVAGCLTLFFLFVFSKFSS